MKSLFTYCLLAVLVFTGSCSCNFQNEKRIPSLEETYFKTDKLPFVSFIAYNRLRAIFHDKWIETINKPFDDSWKRMKSYSEETNYSLYFLITKNLVLKDGELKALLAYVKAGNDLFISADYVDTKLLESMYCHIDRKGEIINEVKGRMLDTKVSLYFGDDYQTVPYGYYYFPFLNAISSYDTAFTMVLGVNEINLPNYAVFFLGSGRIYLNVAPRIFSNYFLLTHNNYQYFENVISYLRLHPKNIYWDEYYQKNSSRGGKKGDAKNDSSEFSTLRVIKNHPPLLWAFCLAVAGMLLFVFFNAKRKQRIINVVKPNTNATVAFTETVGRLYLQHKNNRRIADRMITYFYENIRNKFFINTAVINDDFMSLLAGKSSVVIEEVIALFALITNIQSREIVTDEELLELNVRMDQLIK
ncbi:MAG: hypothetical protein ABIR03_02900 [Ginsengibacter sp.]